MRPPRRAPRAPARALAALLLCAIASGGGCARESGSDPTAAPDASAEASAEASPETSAAASPEASPEASAEASSAAPGATAPAGSPQEAAAPRPGEVAGVEEMPVVEHGPRDGKRIALTLDADMTTYMQHKLADGEVHAYYDAGLIDLLRREQVPATLFLTGLWMEQYPDLTRELAGDPLFELGTHSQTHRGFTPGCYGLGTVPHEEQLDEVTRPVATLDALDPAATRWFRFPGGCYDDAVLRRTAAAGVTAVGTGIAAGDGGATSARTVADGVLAAARDGAIVTLHMHGGPLLRHTAEAVALLVPELRARGFELVTVTRLLAAG